MIEHKSRLNSYPCALNEETIYEMSMVTYGTEMGSLRFQLTTRTIVVPFTHKPVSYLKLSSGRDAN